MWQISEGRKFNCFGCPKGFSLNMRDAICPCVCRRTKLSGRCVLSEAIRDLGREEVRKISCDKWMAVVINSGLDW